MAVSLSFIPGSTVRWREGRFVVVDYAGMEALVAREIGKRRLQRIPVREAVTDLNPGDRDAWTPDLVSVPEETWQTAVRRFKALKPLFELGHTERTFAKVSKIAAALGKTSVDDLSMDRRLRARRAPFGLPPQGALGSGQEPAPEQSQCHHRNCHRQDLSHGGTARCRGRHRGSPASVLQSQRRRCTFTTPSWKTPFRSALNVPSYSPQKSA